MKHYNLDNIEPILRDCNNFFSDLILVYNVKQIKIPKQLIKLKEDIENQLQLNKIEGEEK